MPPRRTSKAAPVKEGEAKGALPATGAPRRMTRSRLTRMKNTSPATAISSGDELDAHAKTPNMNLPKADEEEEEEVLEEIVVSTVKNRNPKGGDLNGQSTVASKSTETPKQLRPGSRASSISKSESAGQTPTRRGTPIKKQEFEVAAAAVADDEEDELAAEEPTPKKVKVIAKSTQLAAFRKGRSKWDNADEMLTNPKSPLVRAKLRDLLCSAKAWDILTYEEKKQILVKFPDEAEILDPGTANARPNVAALRNNNNFRHDVARYQEGLGKGFHDPEWIRQAQAAHSARQLGFYDEFMAADFREKWDLPMPGQIHTAPAVTSREGSHEVGTCGKGRLNDISLQPAAGVQSEETATQSRCVDDATHGKLTEATVRDTQDNQEGTENRRVALGDDMSKTENKGTVRPLESKVKQEGLPEAESVTTGPSTKLGGQQLEDSHYDATALRVPSLPIIMEGVEHESEKEHAGTTKTQHSVKEVETLQITDIPKTVESTRRTEDFANRVQQPDEKKVQSDSSAEQQPGDESRCSAVSARHGSRHY